MRTSSLLCTTVVLSVGFLCAGFLFAGPGSAQISPRLTDALELQLKLAQQHPDDQEILNDLGNLYALAGRWSDAEAVYRAALLVDPDQATTHYNLALALQETHQLLKATAAMERAVELDPANARALYQLGNIHLERGERALAIDSFGRAFRLDPDLALPALNPQVIDNPVLTESLLRAYQRRSRAKMAPRMYERPADVTDLLVPERELLNPTPDASQDETEAATETQLEAQPRVLVTPDRPMFKPPPPTPEEIEQRQKEAPADLEALESLDTWGVDEEDDWGSDATGWGSVDEEAEADRQRQLEEKRLQRQELRRAARERAQKAAATAGSSDD